MQPVEIAACLKDGLDFLTQYDYIFSRFSKTESVVSGDYYAIVYTSDFHKRTICISFFPKYGFVKASLTDNDDDFHFSDAGSMEFIVPGVENTCVKSLDQLEIFLRLLRKELETKYLSLVKGGMFSNDAFDRSPYK